MLRNIVVINEEKCDGCGLCVKACAEGAIQIINGKAKLVSETYCDGLGACLGHCPRGAITIEQRQAVPFDEKAAHEHVNRLKSASENSFSGCPGMKMMQRKPQEPNIGAAEIPSQLGQWPVQLKLLSPTAPYFAQADLMLAADCVPFAMGDFHPSLLKGHTIAVGCPKLDDRPYYVGKVAQILRLNDIRSLTVVRMEVPCCSGLTQIARMAIADSGKTMPFEEIAISLNGQIIQRQTHPA